MMVQPKRGESDMRFMGFSKSYLPARFAALALVGAFVASLGVVALPSEAQAGKKKRNVWSVKYKCSIDGIDLYKDKLVIDLPYINDSNEFVVQTTVNIHNPSDNTRRFNKKVVIVEPQHATSDTEVSDKFGITLSDNEAHSVDCEDIVDMLAPNQAAPAIDPTAFAVEGVFEGFVVIESEKGSKKFPVLVVCANYFAAVWVSDGDEGGGVSTQTLCYKPIRTRFDDSFVLESSP